MLSPLFAGLLALQPLLSPAVASRQDAPASPPAMVDVQSTPVPAERVLAIPQGLREEFQAKVLSTKSPELRLYRLVDFMLKPEGLGLHYKPNANHTVEESYRTREVNCMAFTMMALALAREAGLNAHAQQIDKVMAWDMTGDVVTQSLHANVVVNLGTRKYMLDIAVGNLAQPVVDYKISDEHLLALFYGNRAMDLLVAGRLQEASRWQDEALRHDQHDATLLNNAGVLRQRLHDPVGAERLYLKAVELNPGLTSAVANLVALYRQRGDIRQANVWRQHADRLLKRDPFYQFAQGRREEDAGDFPDAIRHYKRAISLYGSEHLFHFYLARAYFKQGSLHAADSELILAQRLSVGADQQRYQAKRVALQKMMN